jgi:YD repeat-containing protein
MKVFLGRGDGTFFPWRRVFYPWPLAAIDVRNLRLADLNRDGLIDLVRFTAGHVLYFPGYADGTFTWFGRHVARPEQADADVTVAITDANGNGSQDIVWSSPRGMWVLDLAGATSAGMLERIDNGLGKVVSVRYEPSAQLAVDSEVARQPWQRNLPTSVPVPVELTVDLSDGSPLRIIHYGVRDGFWDGQERRFGGFLEGREATSATDAADVWAQVTTFHEGVGDDRVLRGKPIRVRQENGLGALHTEAYTEWVAHPVIDLPLHPLLRVPVQRFVRTAHHEGVAKPIETLAFNEFDGQGRTIRVEDYGRLDLTGDEKRIQRIYAADNQQDWIRDRVCEETTLEADGRLVSRTRTLYGDIAGPPEPFCQIGVGLMRETLGWLAGESRWVRTGAVLEYSSHHNPLRVIEGPEGVDQLAERVLTYDAADFHLLSESVEPQPGRVLTWQLAWDEVRSLATTMTDPSGLVTTVTYDDLNRLSAIANGAFQEPHAHFVYNWVGPRPTTTTYVWDDLALSGTVWGSWPGDWVEGDHWRQTVHVANGAGEDLFNATRLAASRWIVAGWRRRDHRGRVIESFDNFYYDGTDARAATPVPGTASQSFIYDGYGRVREHLLPTGARKRIDYRAFETVVTSDDLDPVRSIADGHDRILRTERTVNGIPESVDAVYDAADRILRLRLQDGAVEHRFVYDALGRMTFASDPDIGDRYLVYDDAGRLIEHTNGALQSIHYTYDKAGRLISTTADDGSTFVYHYDIAPAPHDDPETGIRPSPGRLVLVDEPASVVGFMYDDFGRQAVMSRAQGQTALADSPMEATLFSPSGLALSHVLDDRTNRLSIRTAYDAAGRAVALNDFLTIDAMDASGRILAETYGNGVTQEYTYDANGQVATVQVNRPGGAAPIYDVQVDRNAFGAITNVRDVDGVGLDHQAVFTYDRAARLTGATLGPTAAQFQFAYQYDGLQNMVQRSATGPKSLGLFAGIHHYAGARPGGGTYGPRQLTSISPADDPTAAPTHTFDYL